MAGAAAKAAVGAAAQNQGAVPGVASAAAVALPAAAVALAAAAAVAAVLAVAQSQVVVPFCLQNWAHLMRVLLGGPWPPEAGAPGVTRAPAAGALAQQGRERTREAQSASAAAAAGTAVAVDAAAETAAGLLQREEVAAGGEGGVALLCQAVGGRSPSRVDHDWVLNYRSFDLAFVGAAAAGPNSQRAGLGLLQLHAVLTIDDAAG